MSVNHFIKQLPKAAPEQTQWLGLTGGSIGYALALAEKQYLDTLIIVTEDNLTADLLLHELRFFRGSHEELIEFPHWETLAYDHFSPHQDIVSDRLSALFHLLHAKKTIFVTTIATLLQYLSPPEYVSEQTFVLKIGDKINIDILRTQLIKAGYHSVKEVREHGEFAIRGSLIDIYAMGTKKPFRLDLIDNEIDSIRYFATDTQRTDTNVTEIRLLPAKEFPLSEKSIDLFRQQWRQQFSGNPLNSLIYQEISEGIPSAGIEYYLPLFFDKKSTLFDFIPKNSLMVTIGDLSQKINLIWQDFNSRYAERQFDTTRPILPPAELLITEEKLQHYLKSFPQLQINATSQLLRKNTEVIHFNLIDHLQLYVDHKAKNPLKALQEFCETHSGKILFCAESMGRREVLLQLFNAISLRPTYFESWQAFIESGEKIGIAIAPLEHGFMTEDRSLALITETELYGKRVMQRRLRKRTQQDPDSLIRNLTELNINDAVVHLQHGIGRYLGLQTLTVGDRVAEFLCLAYQDDAKLYVPVTQLQMINRYMGRDLEHTPLNRLGTDHWQKAKRRAAQKVKDVAIELLELYAKRAAQKGYAYEQSEQYVNFAAEFPFEETPDQLQAIEQVFKDMMSDRPMDRVICGDVGFGKTEVAMRASFLAVMNGKQVVILVPTTLLAQQHFKNFQDRYADWPVKVEMLSRFRTSKEQQAILEKIKEGQIDIVIGTHKLLQNEVRFKTLGLVIIDEEHRFGVKQKEKLKTLTANVDLLTLTATPIPRTLNMALSGIRDLSVIATPPLRRLSVKTFVHEYHEILIKEAIEREIFRGGQVYFLHNEIETIHQMAEKLEKIAQNVRPLIAHGQMHERELEKIMSEFYHRRANVLVCSTIIESGIDIPTANTIIINRADKLGLAQLHQLRGRVGRSHHQAYAYLLTPNEKHITADAKKRLEAISAYDDLGIGFTLATQDLEIRGAGHLLGEEQSGDIEEIGFSLYMDLLSRAVDSLKEGQAFDYEKSFTDSHTEIELNLTALIPEQYLHDIELRLQFYKRITYAKDIKTLDDIQVEMIDRFGLLPQPLKNLFAIMELKQLAEKMGINKIEVNAKGEGKLEFNASPNINPEAIIKLIQTEPRRYQLAGSERLKFILPPHEISERIAETKKLLEIILKN